MPHINIPTHVVATNYPLDDNSPSTPFSFNLNASIFKPSYEIPTTLRSTRPIPLPRKNTRCLKTVDVPVHDRDDVQRSIQAFVSYGSSLVGNASSPVHPAIIRSGVYKIRLHVNNRMLQSRGKLTTDKEPMEKSTTASTRDRWTRRKETRVKRGNHDIFMDSSPEPFPRGESDHMDGISGIIRQRKSCEPNCTPEEMFIRTINSNLNKMTVSNFEQILYNRIIPLLKITLCDSDREIVFDNLSKAIIDSAQVGQTNTTLFARVSFVLCQFSNWYDESVNCEKKEKGCFKKRFTNKIQSAVFDSSERLTQSVMHGESLETINYHKDKFTALNSFAWQMAVRSVISSNGLLRFISRLVGKLDIAVVEYEKAVIVFQASRAVFHLVTFQHNCFLCVTYSLATMRTLDYL
eukprot:GHVH01004061.1.p1 GENE.GHVH01004061.1~~GHVH01004061.1.p1  ORF type:complete len:406 (-),score=15.61 GHVH01004061.1:330-1547(-)